MTDKQFDNQNKLSKRRFVRGSQVPDVEKHVAARERRRMRKKAQVRQSQRNFLKFIKSLFGAIVVSVVLFLILSRLFIYSIAVDDAYRTTVDEYFSNSPTQRLKPLFSKDELEAILTSKHPEIGSIEAESVFFSNSLQITVVNRDEALIWTDFSRARSYIIDSQGFVYREHQGAPRQDLLEVRDQSGIAVELGTSLVAPGTVEFMTLLNETLATNSLALDYFVPGEAPQDVQVELANKSYFLLLTTTRPLMEQIEALDFFLDSKLSRGVISYIDVRVPDKVFYK